MDLVIGGNREVIKFISITIICHKPNKRDFPIISERIEMYQTRKHNSYCMRSKNTGTRTINSCRFGFPRIVTDHFIMKDVPTSIAVRRSLKSKNRLYDLPRTKNETCINDYNHAILLAWNGNMDLQFIGEKSCALSSYVTKYQIKPEKSNSAQSFEVINSTKSLDSKLWNVDLRSQNNRECVSLEASDTLLGIPLFGTDQSTTIKWLDINIIYIYPRKSKDDMNTIIEELLEKN